MAAPPLILAPKAAAHAVANGIFARMPVVAIPKAFTPLFIVNGPGTAIPFVMRIARSGHCQRWHGHHGGNAARHCSEQCAVSGISHRIERCAELHQAQADGSNADERLRNLDFSLADAMLAVQAPMIARATAAGMVSPGGAALATVGAGGPAGIQATPALWEPNITPNSLTIMNRLISTNAADKIACVVIAADSGQHRQGALQRCIRLALIHDPAHGSLCVAGGRTWRRCRT